MKNEPDTSKDKETKSIWDKNVDHEKVNNLSPEERARLFPNDFNPRGEPYGDF